MLSGSSLGESPGLESVSESIPSDSSGGIGRHASLRRLQDFVMVTSNVTAEGGERRKKNVVFRYDGGGKALLLLHVGTHPLTCLSELRVG